MEHAEQSAPPIDDGPKGLRFVVAGWLERATRPHRSVANPNLRFEIRLVLGLILLFLPLLVVANVLMLLPGVAGDVAGPSKVFPPLLLIPSLAAFILARTASARLAPIMMAAAAIMTNFLAFTMGESSVQILLGFIGAIATSLVVSLFTSGVTLVLLLAMQIAGLTALTAWTFESAPPEIWTALIWVCCTAILSIAGAGLRVLHNRSQMAAQAKLREKEAMMQHQARMASLGSIAGGIAHEINNPLAILDGLLGRMYRAATVTPSKLDVPTMVQNIEQCRTTIQRINRVIKSMRTLVRSPRSDQVMQVPLSQVVESGAGILQERIRAENIALDVVLHDADEVQVSCMLSELSQVLVNLLQNAIDAVTALREGGEQGAGEGSNDHWIRIEAKFSPQGSAANLGRETVMIRISNSGPKIAPEVEARLFEPFFTTKPVTQGTGLGLSISRQLLERQGGSLRYDRDHPHTCFTIELPITASSQS